MKAYGTKSTTEVMVSSPRCRGRKFAKAKRAKARQEGRRAEKNWREKEI